MKVIISSSHNRKTFHASADCHTLGAAAGLLEVDIYSAKAKPCLICYPDAPRYPKVHRAYCERCHSRRPCRHNGGIRITEWVTRHKPTLQQAAGEGYLRTRWVWPDSKMALAKML